MQRQGETRTNTNPNPRGGAGEKPSCFPAPAPEKSLSPPRPRRRFCSRHRGGQRRETPKTWHWQCTPAGRVCLAVCAPTRHPASLRAWYYMAQAADANEICGKICDGPAAQRLPALTGATSAGRPSGKRTRAIP
uniref:Uncharacterized protein n=1 Tax=Zea mays TaxID=4577 RepID=A0A804NCU5_MAIZE